MDVGVGTPPEVTSIHHDKEQLLHSPKSGRKRKLQLRQLALPMSKHKVRHQCSSSCCCGRRSPSTDHLVPAGSSEDNIETVEESEIEGSCCKGSGSLVKGSDSAMALEPEGHVEMSPEIFVPQFESSPPPSSLEDSAFKDSPYSVDSKTSKNKEIDCQLPVTGVDGGDDELDCQLPVLGVGEADDEFMEEGCPGGPIEDLMLSCDDVCMNTLGLSSARWSIKQDALPGTVRPTIDQEFEQYFSMFMV